MVLAYAYTDGGGVSVQDKDVDSGALARWLIQRCRARNLSWAKASELAGLHRDVISAIIAGAKRPDGYRPNIEVCTKLAEFFGVTPEFLLHLDGRLSKRLKDVGVEEIVARYRTLSADYQELLLEFADALYCLQLDSAGERLDSKT
ncbi:MAG: XRE family transcriptional regulator [Chloroflexi bacterium]|nr:MAG: XRE family transcriptional regulator [Chloroflexota bacterium]